MYTVHSSLPFFCHPLLQLVGSLICHCALSRICCCAAPLLLTGVQFFFQHLLARLVFSTGLIQRTGSPFTWREWGKLGA